MSRKSGDYDFPGRLALDVRDAGPFTRNDFWPGLGRQNAAVGTAFGLGVGEVSGVVEANQNAFVMLKTEAAPADSLGWQAQLDLQRAQSVNAVQQQRLAQWIEALRESARVVDRRDQVLNADQEDVPQMPRVF